MACGPKSENVNLPDFVGAFDFEGIPEHFIFYGFIATVSVIFYAFLQNLKACKSFSFSAEKPSLFSLAMGREDNWLEKERGIGAFHCIIFLRFIIKLGLVLSFMSLATLAINISQENGSEYSFRSTTTSTIPGNSSLQIFNLLLLFCIPWIVVLMMVQLFKRIGKLKPKPRTFNRTLMMENLSGFDKNVEQTVQNYVQRKFPDVELIKIFSASDTSNLHKALEELERQALHM